MPDAPELPKPTPELVAIRCLLEAQIRTLPPKRRAKFLAELVNVFEEVDAPVYNLRATEDRLVLDRARHSAKAWFDRIALRMIRRA